MMSIFSAFGTAPLGRSLRLFAAFLIALAASFSAQAQTMPSSPEVAARAWLVFDANSGQVLGSQSPDMPVEPASITKVMTAFLVFEAIEEGRLAMDQEILVSERAWRAPGSRMFIDVNSRVRVEDLLRGMIVQSGNDASIALAEAVAGSEEAFAERMTNRARELGMLNTRFLNSTGLPDPQHLTTVADLAVLAHELIQRFPQFYGIYQERSFEWNNIRQANRNRLLHLDSSVDGLKTGHTSTAGFCLVASAQRDGRRLISVVVGAESDNVRVQESLKVLNWGFQNFDTVRVFEAGQVVGNAQVWKGAAEQADLVVGQDLWLTVPRGGANGLQTRLERTDPLLAPLRAGDEVGTITVSLGDTVLQRLPLQMQSDVPMAGFFRRTIDTLRLWFE